MAKKFILFLILLSTGMAVYASNLAVLDEVLKYWEPISINEQEGIIEITLNTDRVKPHGYCAVISMGVCTGLWLEVEDDYLISIKEVRILNRYSHSGFVFKSPRSSCDKAGKAGGDWPKIISENTYTY